VDGPCKNGKVKKTAPPTLLGMTALVAGLFPGAETAREAPGSAARPWPICALLGSGRKARHAKLLFTV
jgi:hypothetical protein